MELIKNDLLLKAALGMPVPRPPVWLMRQAGRVLPGYRKIRGSVKDFVELVKTPELAGAATLEPIELLGVDAAIIFSDILVVPESMGLPYQMSEDRGPWFEKTIRTDRDAEMLRVAAGGEWSYVTEAIKIVKRELYGRVPLIGFAGSPFTIFAYITEGAGSKTFSHAKRILFSAPQLAHNLLEKITETTIAYLKDQINAGANAVQIFDSWGGILGYNTYPEFSLKYIAAICDEVSKLAPVMVFPKGAFFASRDLNKLNCSVIGLDWSVDPAAARKALKGKTLQGNLDPCVLYADRQFINNSVNSMIRGFGQERYITNLGHGLYPDTPLDNVRYFVDIVKGYSGT